MTLRRSTSSTGLLLIICMAVAFLSSCRSTKMFVPSSDNGDGTFVNPVIRADFPDPDIIRVGRDYYMVSSTFHCMPGIPVLHSRDLVNWRIIGHAYDSLTFLPKYSMEQRGTAYGLCCWAPTIKYSDGWFYIGVNIAEQRFILCRSRKPEGPYEMTVFDCQFYDPGIFIDDDGRKYVVHGQDKIYITELNSQMTAPLSDPKGKLILDAREIDGLRDMSLAGLEGSHVYKRDGWYYVFNTAKGYEGVQMVSRSRNIFGPYETKKLIDSDMNYQGAGLHQGGFVDMPSGQTWGFLFQDRDYVGRCPVMFRLVWINDWPDLIFLPQIVNSKPDTRNKWNAQYGNADFGVFINFGGQGNDFISPYHTGGRTNGNSFSPRKLARARGPQESDDFSAKKLKPVWEWSHVPVSERYSLSERRGFLRLHAMPAPGFQWARNSLTQRFTGPSSRATALLDVRGLQPGDFAGNGIMGSTMLQQGVVRTADGLRLEVRQSVEASDSVLASLPLPADAQRVWLRTEVTRRGTVCFSWSTDGEAFQAFGPEVESGFFGYLGVRHALACYSRPADGVGREYFTRANLLAARSGYADFDSFIIDQAASGNHYDASLPVDFDLLDASAGVHYLRPGFRDPRQAVALSDSPAGFVFQHLRVPKGAGHIAIRLLAQKPGAVIKVFCDKKEAGSYTLTQADLRGAEHPGLPLKAFPSQWQTVRFPVTIPAGTHKVAFNIQDDGAGLLLRDFQFVE